MYILIYQNDRIGSCLPTNKNLEKITGGGTVISWNTNSNHHKLPLKKNAKFKH